jgi:putative tricarboxylic transport membrane protein
MTVRSRTALFVTVGLVFVALVGLFWRTFTFSPSVLPGYPGDAFFPRLIIGFTLIWTVLIVFKLIFKPDAGSPGRAADTTITIEIVPFITVICVVLAYVLLLPILGFAACTFLFLLGLLVTRWRGDLRSKLWKVGTVSLITTLFFYVAFVLLLNVAFPVRLLPQHITF